MENTLKDQTNLPFQERSFVKMTLLLTPTGSLPLLTPTSRWSMTPAEVQYITFTPTQGSASCACLIMMTWASVLIILQLALLKSPNISQPPMLMSCSADLKCCSNWCYSSPVTFNSLTSLKAEISQQGKKPVAACRSWLADPAIFIIICCSSLRRMSLWVCWCWCLDALCCCRWFILSLICM